MFCTQCQAGVLSSSKSIDFSLFPEVSIRLNLSSLGVDKDGLQSKCWSITGSQITNCVKHINRFKFLVQLKGSGLYFGRTHLHSRASNAELWIGHVVAFGQHCIDHPLQKCWYDDNIHVKNDDDTKKRVWLLHLKFIGNFWILSCVYKHDECNEEWFIMSSSQIKLNLNFLKIVLWKL